MPFHAIEFFCLFLPCVLMLFHWVKLRYKKYASYVLLTASAVFYALWDLQFFPLLLASIGVNFFIGQKIQACYGQKKSGFYLFIGIATNLFVLAFFKYAWIGEVKWLLIFDQTPSNTHSLPLGISFYTLQQITYLVYKYSHFNEDLGFCSYSLYVSFFPQLVAGPIVKYKDAVQQYRQLENTPVPSSAVISGCSLFIFGLGKKVLLADPLGHIVDFIFHAVSAGTKPFFIEAWVACWGYLLQLYFDFSAYSDMAIGIGMAVGISLPVNFNSPLKAISPSDCFNRWHISLTSFIQEYVFTPTYRSLVRYLPFAPHTKRTLGWALATLLSLSLLGFWHGLKWTFVVSGFLIGLTSVLYQLILPKFRSRKKRVKKRMYWGGRLVVLISLTVFGTFFRADSMETVFLLLQGLLDPTHISLSVQYSSWVPKSFHSIFKFEGFLRYDVMPVRFYKTFLYILLGTIIVFKMPNTGQIFGLLPKSNNTISFFGKPIPIQFSINAYWAIITALLFCTIFLNIDATFNTYIYFRF